RREGGGHVGSDRRHLIGTAGWQGLGASLKATRYWRGYAMERRECRFSGKSMIRGYEPSAAALNRLPPCRVPDLLLPCGFCRSNEYELRSDVPGLKLCRVDTPHSNGPVPCG